jgi:nitronate monooxygenase
MWPRKDLIELLGIVHPIIQAPMAGSTTPALVAAVSNAGGLGSLGCARDTAESLRKRGSEIRRATNKPYNLNFFVHKSPAPDPKGMARMAARLKPYYEEFGLGAAPAPTPLYPDFDDGLVDALLELRAPVVSFHFGMPAPEAVAALKKAGSVIVSSATTAEEARWLEDAGVDAIVAQGYEAGGHRGTREPSTDTGLGSMALIPQVADAVRVPVIAAGGIADGRGIAAAFALGASGVQLGTAFLTTPESGINPLYRGALMRGGAMGTALTRAISGRMARGLRNRFIEEMRPHEDEALAFPLQYSLTGPLQAASTAKGSDEMLAMWAGQAVALNRAMPAGELIDALVEETRAVLAAL